ncbi:MAG: hypothetical protein J7L88_01650 [Thermoplasmata archaeon]|nr:hypothetical protein [Thermoplasmata archaeon]
MAELEVAKIKKGLFKSERVVFENVYVRSTPEGEVREITMYRETPNEEEETKVGTIEYEIEGDTVKIHTIAMENWDDVNYAKFFLNYFLKKMKGLGKKKVVAELYDVDNKTHAKLSLFKSMKFTIDSTGNMTGYQSWILTREI